MVFGEFANAVLEWSSTVGLTVVVLSVVFTALSILKIYLNRK